MEKHLQKIEKLIDQRNAAVAKIDLWKADGIFEEDYLQKLNEEALRHFRESLPRLPLNLRPGSSPPRVVQQNKRQVSPDRQVGDRTGSKKSRKEAPAKNPMTAQVTVPKRTLGKRQCVSFVEFDPVAPYVSTQDRQNAKLQQSMRSEEETFRELQNTYGDGWKRVPGKGEHKNIPGGVICNPDGVPYVLKRKPQENVDFFTSVLGALRYCQEHCDPLSESSDSNSDECGSGSDSDSERGTSIASNMRSSTKNAVKRGESGKIVHRLLPVRAVKSAAINNTNANTARFKLGAGATNGTKERASFKMCSHGTANIESCSDRDGSSSGSDDVSDGTEE